MQNADLPQNNPLRRFFNGLAEHVFHARLGVSDTELVDYLSELLLRFTRSESLHRVRSLNGKPIQEVAAMVAEAEHRIGSARCEVHRHIGDIALFWTGLYPETLKRMKSARNVDLFVDYAGQGKRSYHIASGVESDDSLPNPLLERLSKHFEMCAYGLGEIRREWEQTDEHPGPIVLE